MANPHPSNANQAGFTGHIRDGATGLTYMQARYQHPVTGRFLSVDPVDFLADGRTGMVNRYSYTANDPINAIDPTGMYYCEEDQCAKIDQIYDMLTQIQNSLPEGSEDRAILDVVVDAIGEKDEEGSPFIEFDSEIDSVGKWDARENTIRLNDDYFTGPFDPRNYVGNLGHEGSHVAVSHEISKGKRLRNPRKFKDKWENERRAYTVSDVIGYHLFGNGYTPDPMDKRIKWSLGVCSERKPC